MSSDRDESRSMGGFHSYADDTPRDDALPEPPLMAGWADVPAWRQADPPDAEPTARPRIAVLAGGVAVLAIVGGLAWSLQGDRPRPAGTAQSPSPAVAPPLEIVVADPPPPPAPVASAERLQVMPGPASAPVTARPPPPLPTPLAQAVIPVAPPATPTAAPSAVVATVEASAQTAPAARRFNGCDDAPTRAYALVCRDMRLAEADQRMKRAYQAALSAGVPAEMLRRDQEDWLDVREDAAQVSRQAVADIYRQRTRELRAMAEDWRE